MVEELPRRTAHAAHALLVASGEHGGPPTAAEVCIYDEESLSPLATGQALHGAYMRGLCVRTAGGYWCPSNRCYELRPWLEDRFLRETARDGEAA